MKESKQDLTSREIEFDQMCVHILFPSVRVDQPYILKQGGCN